MFFYRSRARGCPLALWLLFFGAHPLLYPSDYNIRLVTDSTPDFTDIRSYVDSITANLQYPQDKAIAIWRWGRRCRHQTRCAWERGRLIWDPVLHFNSYGYMNCGIISALNITAAAHAGLQGRYIQLGDHTVSELSWDRGTRWHLFDSSMSIFCYNHDGVVASCEEIKGAASCGRSGGKSEPGHFYYYHPAPQCASHLGPGGWRFASDNPVENQRTLQAGASSYTSGYTVSRYSRMAQWGRRYILNLKPYQSYTRYWKLLGTGPGYLRPARGEKDTQDPAKNRITRTVRSSGVWKFRPDLSSPDWREFVYAHENLEARTTRPHFAPRAPGKTCRVVFKVDGANVITSMKVEADVVCAGTGNEMRLSVSRNAGLAWKEVWKAAGHGDERLSLELQEDVAGHTEVLVMFEMLGADRKGACGLQSVAMTTLTQVNRLALPRLRRGENRVQVRLGEQEESLVLWPVVHAEAYRETASDARNIYCRESTDSFYKATIGAGANNTPCHIVWRVATPSSVTRLTVGARVCNRGSGYVSLQYSWDGEDYREFFRKSDGSPPFDLMVLETIRPPADARAAWVKCEFFTTRAARTYNTPGVQDIFIRVSHRPRSPVFRPIEVTYCWTEHRKGGDVTRRHTQLITSPEEEWKIRVGGFRDPTMNWVRLRLEDRGSDGVRLGYSDGQDVGDVDQPARKVAYRWGRNLAEGARYTASRPVGSVNGDEDGEELTDNVVIAPTDYFTSNWPRSLRSATAGWDGEVHFDVDLGEVATVSGALVCTHQPNDRYCHPDRVEVSVSAEGKSWDRVGTIHHDDLWNPPGDYESWEYDDDPDYSHLPAGGRLAYRFPLVWSPERARYVRFHFFPLRGRGIGISELQVFDRVDVRPWPDDIALRPLEGSNRATRDSSSGSSPPEKLILGFESEELSRGIAVSREEKSGRDSWFYHLRQREGFDFAARFEWPGATNRAWTWHCRPGEHTQGELALVTKAGPANPQKLEATCRPSEFLSYFYPNVRRGFEAHRLMTAFQWLTKAAPELRDWRGYDRLWIDVRGDDASLELWLAVEDTILEPPVMRIYEVPPGEWSTIELDLEEAVRTRGLDLGRIANFWLMGRAAQRTAVRLDNIRLVRGGARTSQRIIRERNPAKRPSRVRPAQPLLPRVPPDWKPDVRPVELAEPLVVARGGMVPFGWVAARDNRFLFVAYTSGKTAKAVFTGDGGRTWNPLPDPQASNLDHGTARGCAIDDTGAGVAVSSGAGCAGLGHPNPRQHATLYSFTGKEWTAHQPVILDSDIRHCGSNASVVRLRRGPFKGRLWASWGEIDREHAIGVHIKYSDDGGQTWFPWGRGAALPGSRAGEWSDGTYGYPETVVTPYKEHVACFWRHKRNHGVHWSVFDGVRWSPPREVSPVTLNDMDGAYRATMSAVTRGESEIFFTATGLRTVMSWNGEAWLAEPIDIEDGGMLSLAGDVITLFTARKVNRRWKGLHWPRRTTLRFWSRTDAGSWQGPQDLTPEFSILEYRSMAGFSVPPYSPPNFVPLAWSDHDEGVIKLLKVPVHSSRRER